MDFFIFFLKGMAMGFIVAAPIGPVGILCIQRTLAKRYGLAFLTGLGATFADIFYGVIAGFSLAGIADFITSYDTYLRLVGGVLVGWIGFSLIKAPSRQEGTKEEIRETGPHALTSAFFLTLSNPLILLVFAAIFAAMSIRPQDDTFVQASFLVFGIFMGSVGWWIFLMTVVYLMHRKLSEQQLFWINRSSGIILIGFAIYILLSLI